MIEGPHARHRRSLRPSIPSGRRRSRLAGLLLAAAASVGGLGPSALAADWQIGIEAYQRGDYIRALREFWPLAASGQSSAQFNLAVMYAKGLGLPKDDLMAMAWYRRAAAQAMPEAQCNIGVMYHKGQGVGRLETEAVRWYAQAAEAGLPECQTNLGLMYYDGAGIQQDLARSRHWYRKAAEQDYAPAQTYLAQMLVEGEGGPVDRVEALMWYLLASEGASEEVQHERAHLVHQMTAPEIDDAEHRAAAWRRRHPVQALHR